jgi:hypothetical protein
MEMLRWVRRIRRFFRVLGRILSSRLGLGLGLVVLVYEIMGFVGYSTISGMGVSRDSFGWYGMVWYGMGRLGQIAHGVLLY